MAFAPVWEVLSADYETRDPKDSNTDYFGHGELRKLEIWQYTGTQEPEFINDPLPPDRLSQWLHQPTPVRNGSLPVAGIKLLMMVGSVKADEVRQQRTDELQTTLKAFNLPQSLSTCYEFGGIVFCDQLPTEIRIREHESSAHYCRFLGRIGLAWFQDPTDHFLKGIVMMWDPKHVDVFATHLRRLRNNIDLPLILVFTASLVYAQLETQSMRHHENGMRYAEMQTGYHRFNHVEKDEGGIKRDDYAELSQYVSGKAGVISVMKFRLGEYGALLALVTEEIKNHIATTRTLKHPISEKATRLRQMQNSISTLQQLCSSYINEAECLKERASIQLTALFNLISKKDQNLSIEIAKDSKTLDIERTFVASLFAMPLFNWDANGSESVANHRLWVYWVVSVPLTLLTMLGWWFWSASKVAREAKEDAAARETIENAVKRVWSLLDDFRDAGKNNNSVLASQQQARAQTSAIFGQLSQMRKTVNVGEKKTQSGVEVYTSV